MTRASARSVESGAKPASARGGEGRGGVGLSPPASGVAVADQVATYRGSATAARVAMGAAGDSSEQAADAMAARVLGFPAPNRPVSAAGTPPPPLQRPRLGSGAPLQPGPRALLEARFGRDLGHIRVHDNDVAADAARVMGARAFTVGNDIGFAHGAYAPGSQPGQALLAHEVAHAVLHNDGALRRLADGAAFVRMTAGSSVAKGESAVFTVRLEFTGETVSFNATLSAAARISTGAHEYHLSANKDDPDDGETQPLVFFRIAELSTRFAVQPASTNAQAYKALRQARRYLLEHGQVPFHLANVLDKEPGGKSGSSEGGSGDNSILPPEPWLASGLVPAVKAKLDTEHADAEVKKLIGYRAARVEREEGVNTAMLQIERDWAEKEGDKPITVKAFIRVHKDRWEGRSGAERTTYAGEVATEAAAAIERATHQRLWTNPDLAGKGTGGRGYEYPPLPARIEGLNVQPVGGTGTFAIRLDYSVAATGLLGQASWAAKPLRCRWELWDISDAPSVKQIEQQAQASGRLDVGNSKEVAELETQVRRGDRSAGTSQVVEKAPAIKRDFERFGDDMAKRPAEIEADRKADLRDKRYLDVAANYLNRELLELGVVTKFGKLVVQAGADALGDSKECAIPWTRPGVYVLRCIARIDPDAEANAPQRAPSVATMVLTVRELSGISATAVDADQNQIINLTLKAAMLRVTDPNNKEGIEKADAELKSAKTEAEGSAVEVLQARKAEVDRQLEKARKESILIPHGLHDSKVWALELQQDQLATQLKLALKREAQLGGKGVARRLKASLVSRITGQIYPLLLQAGLPVLDKGTWSCDLSDVTSGDGERFSGRAADQKEASADAQAAAVWNAVELFAGAGAYGEGSLSVRLPDSYLPGYKGARLRTFESRTKDLKAAKARLEEVGTLLVVIGIAIGSGGMGVAGGLIAAGLAADRMISRIRNDTWKLDTQAVSDILDMLRPIAMGAKAVGALARVERAGGGFILKVAKGAGKAVGMVGSVADEVANIGGILMCNLETANALMETGAQQSRGEITAMAARRAIADRLAGALQSNAMVIGSHLSAERVLAGEEKKRGGTGEKQAARPEPIPEKPVPEAARSVPKPEPHAVQPGAPEAVQAAPEPPRVLPADAPPPPRSVSETKRQQAREALPDGTVMMDPNPTSHAAARQNYHNMIADAPTHEATIYRNTKNGIYIVVQGNTEYVAVEEHGPSGGPEGPRGAGQAQRWKELLDASEDVGDWELVAHSHGIDPKTGSVRFRDRFPSGATADMGNVIGGPGQTQARTSRIDYLVNGKMEHTLFGYDPNAGSAKVWVDYPDQFGNRQRIEFPNVEGYHQWFKDTFNLDLGPVPPEVHAPAAPHAPAASAGVPGNKPLARNDRVNHPKLGNGTVEFVQPSEGKGKPAKIKVRFDGEAETRTILADNLMPTDVPAPEAAATPRPKPAERAAQAGKKAAPIEAGLERNQEFLKAAQQERIELARKIEALKKEQQKGQDRKAELDDARARLAELEGRPQQGDRAAVPGEIARLEEAIAKGKRDRTKAKLPLYEQLEGQARKKTEPIKKRSGKGSEAQAVDEITGQSRPALNVDHIVPVIDIVLMRGFELLTYAQQIMILTWDFNLLAMDSSANQSKGARAWSEWRNAGDYYTQAQRGTWSAVEGDNRVAIQGWIDQLLAGQTGFQPKQSASWAPRAAP